MTHPLHVCTRWTLLAALASGLALPAFGADGSAGQAQYEKQRAECTSGKSNQDKATCLKEAAAALAESKRGQLGDSGADYRRDQMERCKPLSGAEQRDCIARMKGGGTVSGSVEGGGILREKVTREVVAAPSAAPSAAASGSAPR